jgi:hypothetical protein
VSDFIAERMWPDAAVERSIFGTDDPEAIWDQVREACPDAVGCFAFEVSVGARFGLVLRGGSRLALKFHVGREGPSTSRQSSASRAISRSVASRARSRWALVVA